MPEQTVNEKFADQIKKHVIDLERLAAGQRVKVMDLLMKLQRKLATEIGSTDFGKRTETQQKRMLELIAQLQATIKATYVDIADYTDGELKELAAVQSDFVSKNLNAIIPIEVSTTALTAAQLAEVVKKTMIQGAPSYEWWKRQGVKLQNDFADQMRQGIVLGETNDALVRRIIGGKSQGVEYQGIMDVSRRNAEALVRTSVQTVAANTRMAMFRANSDIIKAVTQHTTFDSRTSHICIAYSGKSWDLNGKPLGHKLPFNGGPPRHWNCRSVLIPVTKSFRELGVNLDEVPQSTRASMDGQIPADKTFDGWLKGKPQSFQDDLLGANRADLWRKGKITLTDLVDQRGRPLTMDELKKRI